MPANVLALTIAWTAVQFGLTMPVLDHLTGRRQDLSDFASVEGSLCAVLVLVALSWMLGAFCEEPVFRGHVPTRVTEAVGTGRLGLVCAALASSVLFAPLRTEQGTIGVFLTFLDGLFFCALRWHFGTLLAPVLAHGLNNTIGLTAFFFVGPLR